MNLNRTSRTSLSVLASTASALALSFHAVSPVVHAAAKPPKSPDPSTTGITLSIDGPIFAMPDYTAKPPASDQCRNGSFDGDTLGQRKTTLDLSALGHPSFPGVNTRAFNIAWGAALVIPGQKVVVNFWATKNCLLTAEGEVIGGGWPLASNGSSVEVTVKAGTTWAFKRYGGGTSDCAFEAALGGDVVIVAIRDDSRLTELCDCPNDYTDSDGDLVADTCE